MTGKIKATSIATIVPLLLTCIGLISYLTFLRSDIILYYETQTGYIGNLIQWIYPNWESRQATAALTDLLKHADQIVMRGSMILVLVSILLRPRVSDKLLSSSFWNPRTGLNSFLIRSWSVFVIVTTYDWFPSIADYENLSSLYKPIGPLSILGGLKLNSSFLYFLYVSMAVSCMASLLKPRFKATMAWSVLALVFLQAHFLSFGKIDQGYTTLIYLGIGLSIIQWRTASNLSTDWILQTTRVTIALTYFIAGLEKILLAGTSWFDANNFKIHLLEHTTPIGLSLAESDALCIILPLLTLVLQLVFPLVLFVPKTRLWLLGGMTVFHLSTVLIFGISSYLHPWIFSLAIFIYPEHLPENLLKWIKDKNPQKGLRDNPISR